MTGASTIQRHGFDEAVAALIGGADSRIDQSTMPNVSFILADGSLQEVPANKGYSIMQAAVAAAVPGIDADCGGACACATCHVYVDAAWAERVGPAAQMEADMLELADHVQPNSRLSCQITMQDAFDGLVLTIPPKA